MPMITLIFGATAALVNLWLGIRCGRVRASAKILHGDGGNALLAQRMRAQLNFIENAPIVILLVLALELSGFSTTWLWFFAVFFIIARILHALGMDRDTANIMRGAGTGLTMLITLALVACALKTGYDAVEVTDPPMAGAQA